MAKHRIEMTWEIYEALKLLTIGAAPGVSTRYEREWREARQTVAVWIDTVITPEMAKEAAA